VTNIPINPSDIRGAVNYTAPLVATPFNICKLPAEGAKFVPMQFSWANNTVWLVNMAGGATGPASGSVISQAACMYVDNTASKHDVNILFPDSGYQVRIGQGVGQLVPLFTAGQSAPKFYVILDSSGATSATDMTNIFVSNQFIPEFVADNGNTFVNSLSYGYGQFFTPTPAFTQSGYYNSPLTDSVRSEDIIGATQWYVTGININGAVATTASTAVMKVFLIDAEAVNVFESFVAIGPDYININPVSMSGLNILSLGLGPLSAQIFLPDGVFLTSDSVIDFNVYGGILIP